MKISLTVFKLSSGHDFHRKFSKGHNSVKKIDRVTLLFLCTSSDGDLCLNKVS